MLQKVSTLPVAPLVTPKAINQDAIFAAEEVYKRLDEKTDTELKALPLHASIELELSTRLNALQAQQAALTNLLKVAKPLTKPVVNAEVITKSIRYCDSQDQLFNLLGRPSSTTKGSRQRSVNDMQNESMNSGYTMDIEEFAERSSQNVSGWQYEYTSDALRVRITSGNPYFIYDSLTVTAYEGTDPAWTVEDIDFGTVIVQ